MIVIYPFFPGDESLALQNAQWLNELGEAKAHDCLMVWDKRCTNSHAVAEELKKCFNGFFHIEAKAEFDGWPQGANYFFRLATSWLQNGGKWPYFFWMEPDAIPLKEGWLDALQGEFERVARPAGKFFMGDRVQVENVPLHLSGVAIYPNPLHAYAGEAYRASDVAWDIAGAQQIVPKAHWTKLIVHNWKHPAFNDQGELDNLLSGNPQMVIFHSDKSGSLFQLLRERKKGGDATCVTAGQTSQDATTTTAIASKIPLPQSLQSDAALTFQPESAAPTCDIFIRTYDKDYPWLNYCLESIGKFCRGFRKVWIVSPSPAPEWNKPLGADWKVMPDESPDGYLAQQITKLYADVITDYSADYILFVDSDNVFTKPTTPWDFFSVPSVPGIPLPIWPFTPYSAIDTPWQPITEKFMGKPVANEFMRRFPILIPRWLFPKLREYCYGKHGRIISEYVRTQPHRSFSEFNALGAFAYEFHRDKFFWVNTLDNPLPPPFARQFHSYSGITAEVKAEIEQILKGGDATCRVLNAEAQSGMMENANIATPTGQKISPQTPVSNVALTVQPVGAAPSIRKLPNDIWVIENDDISGWVEKCGRLDHDPNLLPVILSHIKEGDTVVDAGAFIGDHTIAYLKAVGETGRVFAFEPNPIAYQCLVHNMSFSKKSAPWFSAYPVALGDKRCTVPLSGNNGVPSGGYIGEHQIVSEVSMQPLDSFQLRPELIKIDVEGCELKMLMGAERTIEEYRPKMVIEINKGALERQGATPQQIFDWLTAHGYYWSIIEENAIVHDPLYNIVAWPDKEISRSGRSDGNKSGGIEQSSSPASGTSQEIHRGNGNPRPAKKDAGVLTCCPTASPPVTPFNLFAMSLAIQQLKDFAAIDSNHRMRVMMNLSKAGLTPRWRNKKKKK